MGGRSSREKPYAVLKLGEGLSWVVVERREGEDWLLEAFLSIKPQGEKISLPIAIGGNRLG